MPRRTLTARRPWRKPAVPVGHTLQTTERRRDMATIDTAWRDLTAALEGELVLPGSPRYDELRRPQIPRFHDVRPQAVVLCRTPEDVVEAIGFACRSGIEVAVRSGGHDPARGSSGPRVGVGLAPVRSL